MTNADRDEANAALMFELDEKIEERLKKAIQNQVVNGHEGINVAYMVGRYLLNHPQFMRAMTEEVIRLTHERFNSSALSLSRISYF